MKALSALLLALMILTGCSKAPQTPVSRTQDSQKEEQYRRELEEIRKNIKGDVKIKLKKDGKGDSYSWEISGKDANEILKANDILSKKLAPK
jgi:outer membrane biogenesis lipoprotein LolB